MKTRPFRNAHLRRLMQLKDHGYTNIDGLDPSQGLLDAGMKKGLFKKIFCDYIMPDKQTEIEDSK